MRRGSLCSVLVLAVACLGGCRGNPTAAPFSADDAREAAKRLEKRLRRHPDDRDALRDLAHLRWLHLGEKEKALPVLERLARAGDPVSRAARLVVADARLELRVLQSQAYALIEEAASLSDDADDRELRLWLAEHAARRLVHYHGDLPDDDQRFATFYDRLDLQRLPFEVRQPLTSHRAAIARERGEDYRRYYAAEGCVRRWTVGVVEGSLGELELELRAGTPFVADPEATLAPLSCAVRVWNPTPRAGIRRLQTVVGVPGERLVLNLAAEDAMRAWLDGEPIYRNDALDRWAPKHVLLELEVAPGDHLLEVATAVTSEKSWLLVRATDGDGNAARVKAQGAPARTGRFAGKIHRRKAPWLDAGGSMAGPYYAPMRTYLAVEDALADRDTDAAETLVSGIATDSTFAEGHLMVAMFEDADPSRGRTISSVRERRALMRALDLDPKMDAARLRLLDLGLAQGKEKRVVEDLDALPEGRLDGIHGQMLRWRAYLAHGSEHLAEAALERAAALHPDSCQVLGAQRTLARNRDDVRREDELTRKLAACPGTLRLRASLAERRGRLTEALRLAEQALARTEDDIGLLALLAELATRRGDDQAARKWHERILALNPYRVAELVEIGDLLGRAGRAEEAREQVRHAISRVPHSSALRQTGEALGLEDDLMRWRVDGKEAIASYRASGVSYEGVAEALVLDYSVSRVYENGGQRQIVHQLIELLSKESLDRYGEFSVPDGARLLGLHTIKPDGAVLDPESIAGKDGLSLRDLEIGDIVEYEFVIDRQPNGLLPGYIDVSTFRFRSLDTPFFRSELVVVAPNSIGLIEERRNDPPPLQESRQAGLRVWRWRKDRAPRVGEEPGHRDLLDELPSVRIHTALDVREWLGSLVVRLRATQRTNPELRGQVAHLVAGKKSPRERLRALWRWTLENIEDSGDLGAPATFTLAARGGNRLLLLRAMLREAGLRAELWLARDRWGPTRLEGGHPMVETFTAPMLAVWLPGAEQPVMVVTTSKVMPIGYLAPAFDGTDALRVHLDDGDGPAGPVQVPGRPHRLADRRDHKLELELDARGDGRLRGTIELQGMEALAWRETLRNVDSDRIEELFQQAEIGRLGRGLTLETLKIENEKKLDRPLVLRFEAAARGVGVRQDDALVLPAALVPMNLAMDFAQLPRRQTGLVLPYAPASAAHISIRLKGATFSSVPSAESVESDFGRFSRRITEGGVGESTLELELVSVLKLGIVDPADYPKLAFFAREVDAAEKDVLRAR